MTMEQVVHLRQTDFRQLERNVQEYYGDLFRKVWIQYSNTKSRVRLCITCFPLGNGQYQMLFFDNVRDFSLYHVLRLVKNHADIVRFGRA